MKKAIVCLSGGLDSAVTLATAIKEDYDVLAISFRYPSKHNNHEINAARELCRHYQTTWGICNIEDAFVLYKSALLRDMESPEIPEGHYNDESMAKTVVPARNMIFISILVGIAASREINTIFLGVHSGDHHIYPDCRPAFFNAMQRAIQTALGIDARISKKDKVILLTPFLHKNKTDIVKQGIELSVPFELTRTCYKSQEIACGKCGSCIERLEAFEQNGIQDPIRYITGDNIKAT